MSISGIKPERIGVQLRIGSDRAVIQHRYRGRPWAPPCQQGANVDITSGQSGVHRNEATMSPHELHQPNAVGLMPKSAQILAL